MPKCSFIIKFSAKKYKLLVTQNPWKNFTKTTSINYSTTKLSPFENKTFTTTLNPENNSTITETISTKSLNISENTTLVTTATKLETLNKTKATIPMLIFPPEPNKREKDGIIDALIMFAILILLICVAIGYYLIYLNKKDKPEDEFKSDLSINPVVIVAEDEGLDVDKTQEDEETSSDNENSGELKLLVRELVSADKSNNKVANTVSEVCKEMRASEIKLKSAEQLIREKERKIAN
uniref:Uncharacterized protein n=1 Tax=Meloidogyne enterolobii TaxID=390850 RepID=A0A6V7XT65_MELEN|nr:unnamed protein product [Meloidogyne enterolobii]